MDGGFNARRSRSAAIDSNNDREIGLSTGVDIGDGDGAPESRAGGPDFRKKVWRTEDIAVGSEDAPLEGLFVAPSEEIDERKLDGGEL